MEQHEKVCGAAALPSDIPEELILDSKQRAAEEREAAKREEEMLQVYIEQSLLGNVCWCCSFYL